MKNQPKRQHGLDRKIGIDRVAFGRALAGNCPMIRHIIGNPDPKIAPLTQRGFIVGLFFTA